MNKIKKITSESVSKTISGLIIFVITWITIDLSGLVEKIHLLFNINNNLKQYYILIDVLIKVSVGLFLLLLYLITCQFFRKKDVFEKRYSANDIVSYLCKHKIEIEKITIFGYSLTFARNLREYLEKISNDTIVVDIILPSKNIVEKKLIDSQSTTSRLETINGRIQEWICLEKEKRVKKINIFRTDNIPLEHGFQINSEIIFFWYYKWYFDNNKFVQKKHSLNNRDFYLIDKRSHPDLYDYMDSRLTISQNLIEERGGDNEC